MAVERQNQPQRITAHLFSTQCLKPSLSPSSSLSLSLGLCRYQLLLNNTLQNLIMQLHLFLHYTANRPERRRLLGLVFFFGFLVCCHKLAACISAIHFISRLGADEGWSYTSYLRHVFFFLGSGVEGTLQKCGTWGHNCTKLPKQDLSSCAANTPPPHTHTPIPVVCLVIL